MVGLMRTTKKAKNDKQIKSIDFLRKKEKIFGLLWQIGFWII